MIQKIVNWDYRVFENVHAHWHNAFFDFIFPYLRNPFFWSPLYLFLIVVMYENFGKKGLTIKYQGTNGEDIGKTYTPNDWLSFTELIHGQLQIFNRSREKSSEYETTKYDEEKSANLPIYMKGDNINIYEAKGKKDCINYTHSLTNKTYTFCIGRTEPSQNQYNNYRNTRSAKFYYIVDLNKVEEQFNKWVNYLPYIQPYFAVKSNPDDKIINLFISG